jgi:hypothetical protein
MEFYRRLKLPADDWSRNVPLSGCSIHEHPESFSLSAIIMPRASTPAQAATARELLVWE